MRRCNGNFVLLVISRVHYNHSLMPNYIEWKVLLQRKQFEAAYGHDNFNFNACINHKNRALLYSKQIKCGESEK